VKLHRKGEADRQADLERWSVRSVDIVGWGNEIGFDMAEERR
jgi:hypothetical protein